MADTQKVPLTVETAKRNLRQAADAMSLSGYVKSHPYHSLAVAFFLGILSADNRHAQQLLLGSQLLNELRL